MHRIARAGVCTALLCIFFGAVSDARGQLTRQLLCQHLDTSADDCTRITSVTFNPPDSPWLITTETSVAGGTSLRSADINNGQQSCLILELSLPANSAISVAARARSDTADDDDFPQIQANDRLQINADNLRLDTISAQIGQIERDWQQQRYFLPTAISTLSWCYIKDDSDIEGQDAAWIDNLSFSTSTVSYQSRICTALDLTTDSCSLIQSLSYEPPESLWIVTTETSVAGGTSLRSANIGNGQQSCLILELSLPTNSVVSVAARTSSDAADDRLQIIADNLRLDTISAQIGQIERDWQQQRYFLPTAISTLSWCYIKDDSDIEGQDAAWIDNLSFSTSAVSYQSRICTALDLTADSCSLIQSLSYEPPESLWIVTTETSVAGGTSLRSAHIDNGQQSCLVLELSLPINSAISVAARTSTQGPYDHLQLQADNLLLDTISAAIFQVERNWLQQNYFLPAAITTLSWCYVKSDVATIGFDTVWIDNLSFSTSNITYKNRICTVLDLADSSCSMIQSLSYEPPEKLWVITAETAVTGGSSLRSPSTDNRQQSCLILELSLPTNSVISVAGRTSSEGDLDQLQIFADNLQLDVITARKFETERNWRQQSYYLTAPIATLRWCYVKNLSVLRGSDAAWIDNLSFSTSTISYQSRVCAALDVTDQNCAQIDSISYEPPQLLWTITSATSVAGGSSLRSAYIDGNQQNCLVVGISLPIDSVVSIAGRTSSYGGVGKLQIGADKLRLDSITAALAQENRNWRQENYFLPTAVTTLRFCYFKRNTASLGHDAAWIDNLSFSTSDISYQSRICTALNLAESRCSLIQSIAYEPPQLLWIITSEISVAGGTSLRSADVGTDQSTCLNLEVDFPSGSQINFSHRLSTEGFFDILHFEADSQRLGSFTPVGQFSFSNWRAETFNLTAAATTLRWCYVKNSFLDRGNDSIWIDSLAFSPAEIDPFCNALDLLADSCALLQPVTYEPPQNRWERTTDDPLRGTSALISPPIDAGQSACVSAELHPPLPAGSNLAFSWRTTSQSEQDILRFQTGSQQRQISNAPQWQTEYIELDSLETALRWCYSKNSPADSQTTRAWLDSLYLVTPADRYRIEIAVISSATLVLSQTDTFQYTVAVSAESSLLPPPADWVLIVSGVDNIVEAESTYSLSFENNVAQVEILSTPDNPLLPAAVLLTLADRPSFFGATATSISYSLPARELAMLQLMAPNTVTQAVPDTPIEIAVTVAATDNSDVPVSPSGLTLNVSAVDNIRVPLSRYALNFTAGMAQTTVTINLLTRGNAGSIELSVTSGDIQSTASIFLNPAPRKLVSITLSAASTNLVQTTANTSVMTELTLTALDNYGDPIEAGNVSLQLSASNKAVVQSSLTLIIEAAGTTRQTVAILPQNDLDTTVTVLILRGSQDQSVQLLPDGGIQIAVRARRILRELQLSLADRASPLQQIDRSLSIRARVQLIGLDQYDQPIAFPEVTLTAAADPSTTQLTLNPPQLSSTLPAEAITVLEVMFPEILATTVTITIASPGTGITANELVVRALPDPRPPLPSLNADRTDPDITELDLIVALRYMSDPQSSTASLAVNLTVTTADITATATTNLQQLFSNPEFLTRVDVNGDGRADQLDLRTLLRYLSGLRGTLLAEQKVSADIIRLLLDQP